MNNEDFLFKLDDNCSFEGEFLSFLREKSRGEGIPVMLKSGALLLSLTTAVKRPKSILEIGTAVGYSGSLMLKYSSEDSRLTTIEMDEKSVEKAKKNFEKEGLIERVKIFVGDAEEIIPVMSGSFDFILLDGPKSRYSEFFPYLKKMLVSGGVLFSDNVLFRDFVSGEVNNPHRMQTIVNNMRDFLDLLTKDEDFVTKVFDIGDGIAVSVKK